MSSANFTCPSGGKWYACGLGQFFGCCGTDPCSSTCPQGLLYPTSFNSSIYGQFPDQTCPPGSSFWTCTFGDAPNTTPFVGCCKTNPCAQNGCPSSDLTPARFDSEPSIVAPLLSPEESKRVLGSVAASASATGNKDDGRSNTGIYIGAAIAGIVMLSVAIGFLVWWWRRRRQRTQYQKANSEGLDDFLVGGKGKGSPYTDSYPSPTPPSALYHSMASSHPSPNLMPPYSPNMPPYFSSDGSQVGIVESDSIPVAELPAESTSPSRKGFHPQDPTSYAGQPFADQTLVDQPHTPQSNDPEPSVQNPHVHTAVLHDSSVYGVSREATPQSSFGVPLAPVPAGGLRPTSQPRSGSRFFEMESEEDQEPEPEPYSALETPREMVRGGKR